MSLTPVSRGLRLVGALLAALIFHVIGVRLYPDFSQVVSLFLVVLVINALSGDTLLGMLGGMLAGLVEDTVTGSYFGLYGLVGTVLGYGVSRAAQMLSVQSRGIVTLMIVFAAALQQLLIFGLLVLLSQEPPVPQPLWLMIKSIDCGLLGIVLLALGKELERRTSRRQGSRVGRVRLG